MEKQTLKIALLELKEIKAREAEYEMEVDDWYRNGDGRPKRYVRRPDGRMVNMGGQGWAFPHCIHGTSNWTDYDNICGGCEDDRNIYRTALDNARYKVAEYERRRDWIFSAPRRLPVEMRDMLRDWAAEALM